MQLGKEKFIAAVRKFMQMDKLTSPLLRELIDRIYVYEVTGTGKNRKQMYKFVEYLELPSFAGITKKSSKSLLLIHTKRHTNKNSPEKKGCFRLCVWSE